jgi:hypothetical protein
LTYLASPTSFGGIDIPHRNSLTAQIRHVSQSRSRASSLHMRQRVPRPASSAHAMHLRLFAAFIRGGASPTHHSAKLPLLRLLRRLSASAAAATPPPTDGFRVSFMFEADPHGADRSGCMLARYIGATPPCNSAYPSDKRHLGVPCRSRAMLRASYQSPALRSDHGDSNRPVCTYR